MNLTLEFIFWILKQNIFMEFKVKFIYGIWSKIYLWNLKKHLFMELK